MKKTISISIALFLLLAILPNVVIASQEAVLDFYTVTGSWEMSGQTVKGGGDGNVFCMSETYVDAQSSWIFTADVKIISGNAAGLAFGIPDTSSPANRWHCVNFSKSGGYSAMFRETNAKNDYIQSRSLTDAEKSAQTLNIRIECDEGKTITGYVNGTVTYIYQTEDYSGGYVGVMCCSAEAVFSNISLKLIDKPKLTSLTASGVEFDIPFSPDEDNYWAEVDFSVSSTFITAGAADGLNITVAGKNANSSNAALNVGLNVIPVTVTALDGVSRTVYVNIVRRQSESLLFQETMRNQLHFSPDMFSVNDPNGLIYDACTGLYHMFFQCDYAFRGYKNGGETKSWGHAVSRNLIDWEEVGLAITPDENGVCWSGSGVIDKNNTSGLFDASTPEQSRMVFLYTYYGGKNGLGLCSVGLAYSTDHGQTFKKYKEAVIPNTNNEYSAGFRDPKVIWYEDSSMENGGIWVLIACGDKAMLFTSEDLISWEYNSTVNNADGRPLTTECPDLFPMEYNGRQKWVLFASGAWYVIGDLSKNSSGKMEFTTETKKITPVNGVKALWNGASDLYAENYASQTFYNTADGRRIQLSWTRDFGSYSGKLWWNGISLATELRLEDVNGEPHITYHPISEFSHKRSEQLLNLENVEVKKNENPLKDITGPLLDIEACIEPGDGIFGFRLSAGVSKYIEVRYDAAENTVYTDKSHTDTASAFIYKTKLLKSNDGAITVRIILDTNAVDTWFNGEIYHGGMAYITNRGGKYEFFTDDTVKVRYLKIYRLREMNRNSVSQDQIILEELAQTISSLLSASTLDTNAARIALESYTKLSSGQTYCMPDGAVENAEQLAVRLSRYGNSGTSTPLPPAAIWGITGGCVIIAALSAWLILTNIRRKNK